MTHKQKTAGSIVKSLGSGFVFNLVGTVFSQGSTFIFSIVVANLIGKRAFGEYSMTIGTLSSIVLLTQLSCGITNTRFVAEFRTANKPRAGRILTLTLLLTCFTGIAASLGLLLSAPVIAAHVLNNETISLTLRLGAFYVLFASLITWLLGALAGLAAFNRVARAGVISGMVYICLCVSLSRMFGLYGAITGILLSAVLQTVVLALEFYSECRKQEIRLSLENIRSELGIVTGFMFPATLSSYVSAPALWSANAFLARQPTGYEELALYSAANNIRLLALFMPNIINTVSMTLLNNNKGEERAYKYTYVVNILAMMLISLAVALPVTLLGKTVLGLFGSKFIAGYPILVILMVSTIPESLGISLFQHIHAQNRMWLSLVTITVPQSLLLVVLAFTLVAGHGAQGLATSYALSWLAAAMITLVVVRVIGHENSDAAIVRLNPE